MERFINMDLWHKFRLAELDQVMRQDDEVFVNMLNKIRVGEIDQKMLSSCVSLTKMIRIIQVTLCIFLQKMPQLKDNVNQLISIIPGQLIATPAKDEVPENYRSTESKTI